MSLHVYLEYTRGRLTGGKKTKGQLLGSALVLRLCLIGTVEHSTCVLAHVHIHII